MKHKTIITIASLTAITILGSLGYSYWMKKQVEECEESWYKVFQGSEEDYRKFTTENYRGKYERTISEENLKYKHVRSYPGQVILCTDLNFCSGLIYI